MEMRKAAKMGCWTVQKLVPAMESYLVDLLAEMLVH